MAFIDGVSRLLRCLSDINSADSDSFTREESILDFPVIPILKNGWNNVPEELISEIIKDSPMGKNQSYRLTLTRRPDLKSENRLAIFSL